MKILRVVLCCAVAAATSVHAQKSCSGADAAAAQKAVDKIVTWQNLEKAFHDYGHCDTGTVEDGFTDALMRLMVGWKNVDAVAAATARDAAYKAWVHKHLLSPLAKDDREDVYALAKKNCPAKQDAFCAELAEVVRPVKAEPLAPLNLDPIKPITGK
jgi:hypothetical protein